MVSKYLRFFIEHGFVGDPVATVRRSSCQYWTDCLLNLRFHSEPTETCESVEVLHFTTEIRLPRLPDSYITRHSIKTRKWKSAIRLVSRAWGPIRDYYSFGENRWTLDPSYYRLCKVTLKDTSMNFEISSRTIALKYLPSEMLCKNRKCLSLRKHLLAALAI